MIEETEEARESHAPDDARRRGGPDPALPPPVRRIVVDSPPTVAAPTVADRGVTRAPRAARRARAHDARRPQRLLRPQGRGQGRLDRDPPGRGARAHRPVGLWQDDAAAHAQPPHRADRRRARRDGAIAARRPRHRRARGHRAAPPRGDGLPAAQPVPDVDLRQRRLRAARAGDRSARARPRSSRGRVDALQRAGLYDEVGDDLDRPALRLSGGQQQRLCIARAIADAARGAAHGRAVLGAGPALDGGHRGAHRRAAPRAGDRDRHPQPAAGLPRGRPASRSCTSATSSSTARPSRSSARRALSARATTSAVPSGDPGCRRAAARSPRWPCRPARRRRSSARSGPRAPRSSSTRRGSRSATRTPTSRSGSPASSRTRTASRRWSSCATPARRRRPAYRISIAVTDAEGKSLYRNDVAGLEDSLVVDGPADHGRGRVLGQQPDRGRPAGRPRSRRGWARRRARCPRSRRPSPSRSVTLQSDSGSVFAKGSIVNRSKVAQKRLTIFGVARKGAAVVAPGRGILDKPAARGRQAHPVHRLLHRQPEGCAS